MVISRSSWEKLVELWDISEIVSTISRALASLYMVKAGLRKPEVNVEMLKRSIEECEVILRKLHEDLDLYMSGIAPETELVTLLINAFGNTDVEKIRRHLNRALQGLEKLVKAIAYEPLDTSILDDKDVVELEDVLRRISDTLSKKVEQMASEIYAF